MWYPTPNTVALPVGAALLAFAASSLAAEPVFVETNGIVVVEVESCPPTGNWLPQTEMKGFTGRCYYFDKGGGVLRYRILITNPGQYQLSVRNRHDFHDSTLQNDCFTRMDNGPRYKTFSGQRGQWTWATRHDHHGGKPAPIYDLDAGYHTFEISSRSTGFAIDRFHLYREGTKNALDTSLPESRSGPPDMDDLVELKRVNALIEYGALGAALAFAERKLESKKPAEQDEARKAVDALKSYAEERRSQILKVKSVAPVECVGLMMDLAKQYGGSQTGKDLMDEARTWCKDPAYKNAIRARAVYAQIERVARPLDGKGNARDEKFAMRYRSRIAMIKQYTVALKKRYPDTPACRKAEALASKLGITVD